MSDNKNGILGNPILLDRGNLQNVRVSSSELNEVQFRMFNDRFSLAQGMWGLFSYMTLNNLGKYTLTNFSTDSGFMLPFESCIGYSPTGNSLSKSRTFQPSPYYDYRQHCSDEFLGSCYQHLMRWQSDGDSPELTGESLTIWNKFIEMQIRGMAQSRRLTQFAGGFHDIANELRSDLSQEKKDMYLKGAGTFRGLLSLLDDMSQDGYPWLNCANLIDPNAWGSNCKYNGDILDDIDQLICEACPELKQIINDGSYTSMDGVRRRAIIVLDRNYYNAVIQKYKDTCQGFQLECNRVTKQTISYKGVPETQYFIDEMPVVRLDSVNDFDVNLKGDTHFMAITMAGNWFLGDSFGSMDDDLENTNTGVKITRNDGFVPVDFKKGLWSTGKYHIVSHTLLDVRIADPCLTVAAIGYSTSEK